MSSFLRRVLPAFTVQRHQAPLSRRMSDARSRAAMGMALGALVSLAVSVLLSQKWIGARWEHDTLDFWFSLREPLAPRHVAILAVDDATVRRWGGRPFDAPDVGRLLLSLRRAGVRAAALPFYNLTDKTLSTFDRAGFARDLAACRIAHLPVDVPGSSARNAKASEWRALKRFAIEVAPGSDRNSVRAGARPGAGGPQDGSEAPGRVPDETLLNAAAGAGHISLTLDRDGRVREMPLVLPIDGLWCPSLAVSVARQVGGGPAPLLIPPTGKEFAWNDTGKFRVGRNVIEAPDAMLLLNYPYMADNQHNSPFTVISVATALDHPESLRALAGKTVVIGPSVPGLTSFFSTPTGQRVPAIELHAVAIENLLSGKILEPAPIVWVWMLTLLPCLLVGGFAAARHPIWSGGVALVAVMCLALMSLGLFARNLWLDVSGPWIAVGITFLIGVIGRARRQERDSTHIASTVDALTQASEIIAAQTQQRQLLDRVLHWAVSVMNGVGASALLLDEDGKMLHFAAATGPKAADLMPFKLEVGKGIAGWVAHYGKPVIVNDVQRDPRFRGDFDQRTGFATDAILCVPLRVRDKMLGVIEVVNRMDGMPFTHADSELLLAVANQAAIALENARLYDMLNQRVVQQESELAVTNAHLEAERNLLHTVLQSMTDGIVVADRNGMVQLINPAAAALLPELADRDPGTPLARLLPDLNTPEGMAPGKAALLQRGDIDAPRLIEARIAPLQSSTGTEDESEAGQGRPGGMVAVFADVTEERQIEQSKSDFVSFVAHEMRSPLTSISGFSSMLQRSEANPSGSGVVPASRMRFLGIIKDESERLTRLINNLLDVARIEAGHAIELNCEAFDFDKVAEEAADSQRGYSSRHQIKCDVPPGMPPVFADRDKVKQIIINLVSNSLKYSPGGQVTIAARLDGEFLRISISDEGPGIAPEQRKMLFERFGRTSARNIRANVSGPGERAKPTGTGLGLFLTKHLVTAHGGRIWVDSEFGHGATFHFTLPVV